MANQQNTLRKRLNIQNPIRAWQELSPRQREEAKTFYLWVSPWLLGFLVWQLWPIIESFYLSFTNFRLLNIPSFTGLTNVERMLNDDLFWQSMKVTLIYVLGAVPISTIFALFVAMVLAQKLRIVNTWRTIFFMPSVVAGVAVAVMWSFIYNPDFGLLNTMLSWFGIDGPQWIYSERWALFSIILIAWWTTLGSQMVIYLAGIKGIPQILYEAAEIDGATPWAKFRFVTLPMLSPTIFFNVVIGIIGAFQVFDTPFVLTDGGPNYASHVYIINVYEQAFINTNMGYASLLAWVLFIIIVIMTVFVTRYSQSHIYYESEVR